MFAGVAAALVSACGSSGGGQLFSSTGSGAANRAGAGNTGETGGADSGAAFVAIDAGGESGASELGGAGLGGSASGGAPALALGGDSGAADIVVDGGAGGAPTNSQAGVAGSQAGSDGGGRGGNGGKACAGHSYAGICWYLGDPGWSCDGVCSDHGQYADQATRLIGTPAQGGTVDACKAVLNVLGVPALVVTVGVRANTSQGFGCHLFGATATPWWLTDPPFRPLAFNENARIACGCTE
jgi:hypothetical protein